MNATLPLSIGSVIQDTYRVDAVLGQGGMGATYRGTNLASDHQVAIKVVLPEHGHNTNLIDLFRREAKLLRTVQNPAVVRFETIIQDSAGRLFLVMEFIEGKPLSHFISQGARLMPEDVLKFGHRLASGLAAIHDLGIIHRDISPDNILVPDEDILSAKFIDFGLASDTVGTDKSIIGDNFAGKVAFAAPEQLVYGGVKITPATDVYALGLVLMQVAGLEVPGMGLPRSELEEARQHDILVSPQASGSDALAQVLSAMLRCRAKDRPADLGALFEQALAGGKIKTGGTGGDDRSGGKGILIAGLVAATLVAGGAALMFLPGDVLKGVIGDTSGTSLKQVETVPDILASPDPLATALELAGSTDFDERNTALTALVTIGRSNEFSSAARIDALLAVARMYDPATFDARTSAAKEPSAIAARQFYKSALDLGSDEAQRALDALPD